VNLPIPASTRCVRAHPEIESCWELSADGQFGAPRIGVIGALHGNETAGLRVIERVLRESEAFVARMQRGTILLVHGNPRATAQARRFSEGGTDINRLFSYGYLAELARAAWSYEHERALELRPLITGLDGLIDLHSATRPTLPFAICDGTPAGIELARKTGCRVTYGWDGPGMLMEHVSIGSLVAQGKPALSVECGQHDQLETADAAYQILTRFLGALGLTDHPVAEAPAASYRLFGRVVKPTHEFELARDFSSFDSLLPGELLGQGEGVSISVEREAFLLLPTPQAVRGEDLVYLARCES
jgi:succinylglutamate desuccinylase